MVCPHGHLQHFYGRVTSTAYIATFCQTSLPCDVIPWKYTHLGGSSLRGLGLHNFLWLRSLRWNPQVLRSGGGQWHRDCYYMGKTKKESRALHELREREHHA
jgi:hypothetical protein